MDRDYNLIAIGVDENKQIYKAHFGMAKKYLIFNKDAELVREVENPYATSTVHHDNPTLVINLLSDVGNFIAHRMGKTSRQRLETEFRVRSFLTEETTPEDALRAFLDRNQG